VLMVAEPREPAAPTPSDGRPGVVQEPAVPA
jgi:hypothetical protein